MRLSHWYFYKNVFSPPYERYIRNDKRLAKNIAHKIINEIFSPDKEVNKKMKVVIQDRDKKFN